MQHVLVVGQIHEAGMEILRNYGGLTIDVITDPGADIPVEKVEASDAVLIRYGILTEAQIENAERLRVVSRHGVGCDNLPVGALSARGIPVAIVGPVSGVSVAEQTMAMLLSLAKKIVLYDQAVRSGNWSIRDDLAISELAGKTLLLLGFGNIGREVAKRALAFDMNVLVYDPFVSSDVVMAAGCAEVDEWRAVLGEVDVLSLHVPLSAETRNLINAEVLALMKPSAILLNAARGGLIDEAALYDALSSHLKAGGAGIDTFEVEPLSPDSPLLSLPNVVVSPHSAALTEEASKRMGVVAAANVIAGLEGRLDPELVINHAQLG